MPSVYGLNVPAIKGLSIHALAEHLRQHKQNTNSPPILPLATQANLTLHAAILFNHDVKVCPAVVNSLHSMFLITALFVQCIKN